MLHSHEIEVRVRYQETDGQGRVHHGNFVNYFEIGRVELLRASGHSYQDLEETGIVLVVSELNCRYYLGAFYDDLLRLKTTVTRSRGVRIEHDYEVFRGEDLVADGRTVIACVRPDGKVQRLPKWLMIE
jgi:acyl-CoA thioester hydrolase